MIRLNRLTALFLAAAVSLSVGTSPAFAGGKKGKGPKPVKTEVVGGVKRTHYGAVVATPEAQVVAANALPAAMGSRTEMETTIRGPLTEVCQSMGCWTKMDVAGQPMRIMMKDHKFFLPKDASGKTATIKGTAKLEETSVAELRHYAEDAGRTAEEVAAITEPKRELVFTAEAVMLQ